MICRCGSVLKIHECPIQILCGLRLRDWLKRPQDSTKRLRHTRTNGAMQFRQIRHVAIETVDCITQRLIVFAVHESPNYDRVKAGVHRLIEFYELAAWDSVLRVACQAIHSADSSHSLTLGSCTAPQALFAPSEADFRYQHVVTDCRRQRTFKAAIEHGGYVSIAFSPRGGASRKCLDKLRHRERLTIDHRRCAQSQ